MPSKVLRIIYTADAKGLTGGLKQVDSATKGFADGVKRTIGSQLPISWAAAGAAVIAFGASAIKSYEEHERVLAQLQLAIKRTPQLAGETTKAFQDQATALQNLTGYQDEEILSADTVLSRFKLTGAQIRQTVPLVLDYARATGIDTTSAATNLGKALLGNTRALKTLGINYKLTGNQAVDLANIQDLLQKKVGGTAEAFGKTFAGQVAILNAQIDDLKETIGKELVTALVQVLGPMIAVIDKMNTLKVTIAGTDITLLAFIAHLATAGPSLAAVGAASGTVSEALADQARQQENVNNSVAKGEGHLDGYHQKLILADKQNAAVAQSNQDLANSWINVTGGIMDATTAVRLYLANERNLETFHRSAGMFSEPVHFQHGGRVPGYGGGDRVPALLEPGETVLPKEWGRGGGGLGGITIIVQGSVVRERELLDHIHRGLLLKKRRGATLGLS